MDRASPNHATYEAQFRGFLDKLPAPAYTCDPDGLITYFNPHAEALWGRAPRLNDPVDRFCGSFKLFATDGSPISHDRSWMALCLQMGREYNGHEIVIERPDGQRVAVLAHANPLRDETGRSLGAVNVLVDISDRKRAEEALKDADRAKDEFLATLAHELRNPLAPIRTALHLLQLKGPSAPNLAWALDVIDRQTKQMTRLIDDLLDVARITTNKLELRKERTVLTEILETAVATSRPRLAAAGQELIVAVPSQPTHLDVDVTRMSQAISNLLDNAARYGEHGGRVWLSAAPDGRDVVVSVRDAGIGIPREMLPRIFEPFTQVDGSPDRPHDGLGIGLTLVKRLVELHQGTITAHSAGLGKGSEFVMRLPAVVEPLRTARQPEPGTPGSSAVSPLRILIVDDNRDSVETLGMLLQMAGHEARTAHDGAEAVRMAEAFGPDVVLLDIGLPKLNGYEAAQRIRREPWGRTMVLIATTGWGQESDRQRSRDAGFDHHLVKPVDPTALIALLATLTPAARFQQGASAAD